MAARPVTVDDALSQCPVVAILRGVRPEEIIAHAEALHAAGVRVVEVPLNSPAPFESLRLLSAAFGEVMACGSGTVLSLEQVDRVAGAGGRFVVSPNTDPRVIARAVELGLDPVPGFATASEAFAALAAGSRHLKLFPAATYGPGHLGQLKAVLPERTVVWAVGGVSPDSMAQWWNAGARAFGLGSELYRVGQSATETGAKVQAVMTAARTLAGAS